MTLSGWRIFIQENKIEESRGLLTKYLKIAEIPPEFENKIFEYLKFLLIKNDELNLISRKLEIETVIIEHIYDCLSCVKYFEKFKSITDIGTGGGFPGILLGIVFPDKKIELIEKSPKKVHFLEDAIVHLKLENVCVSLNLVSEENIITSAITCRGFKSIPEILEMTQKFFFNNGKYVLYKGRRENIDEELLISRKKYKFSAEIIRVAEIIDKERHVVLLQGSF
jgi:16S rRNA (guanine527-N7)-methyltransferase